MRSTALALVSVLALAAPAFASGSTSAPAAPATPAPAQATPAPAQATPATAPTATNQIPADIGKMVDPATIPALRNIIVPGTQIRYVGDEFGLKAYFVTNQGTGQVIYISPDGQASVIGGMFGADGTPISVMQLARLREAGFDPVPFLQNGNANAANTAATATTPASTPAPGAAPAAAPQQSPGEQLMAETRRASYIAFGPNTGREIAVFMDPNCDHCHNLFKKLQTYVDANKLYLRVIPVAIVSDSSRGDLINILSGADPQASWVAKINGQPVPPPASVNPQAEASVATNTTLFSRWQLPVTPYSVYRTNSGEVKVLAGTPTDFNAFFGELGITP